MSAADVAAVRATAGEVADAARVATLRHFRARGLAADNKLAAGFDPVTVADRLSEDMMRDVLGRLRPDDGILGEERAPVAGTSGLTWILDPIDGTRGYLSGTPTWGVLIALADAEGPIYGVIDQPYIGERFEGGLGIAELAGPMGRVALQCREARPLREAILFSTFPEIGTAAEEAAFRRLVPQMRLTRYGMDCYAYALIAAGQIDLVVEAGLQTLRRDGPDRGDRGGGGDRDRLAGRPCASGRPRAGRREPGDSCGRRWRC